MTVAATLTVITAIMCLVTIGLLIYIYAFVEENPDVEGVSFALAIAAIIIGVIVSIVALALE